jgi:hypothetical protein
VSKSPAEQLAELPDDQRREFIAALTPGEIEQLLTDWHGFHARPEQLMPAEPARWLALAALRAF